jgi:hypothetical protein
MNQENPALVLSRSDPPSLRSYPGSKLATGFTVAVKWELDPTVKKQIEAGEPFDLVIINPNLVQDLTALGVARDRDVSLFRLRIQPGHSTDDGALSRRRSRGHGLFARPCPVFSQDVRETQLRGVIGETYGRGRRLGRRLPLDGRRLGSARSEGRLPAGPEQESEQLHSPPRNGDDEWRGNRNADLLCRTASRDVFAEHGLPQAYSGWRQTSQAAG